MFKHNLQDILHPLATVQPHLEKYPYSLRFSQMAVLEENLYCYRSYKGNNLTFAPLADLTSWSELSLPPDVNSSALTTYQSQLVLVGGCNSKNEPIDKVWASRDGKIWHQSIPPMKRCRRRPAAASNASPECLIVVDSNTESNDVSMEVLFQGEWISVQPPWPLSIFGYVQGIIHNGSLYLYDGRRQCGQIFFCKVESLLASPAQIGEVGKMFWRTIIFPVEYNPFTKHVRVVFSFKQLLCTTADKSIYIYSPNMQSWLLMDGLPFSESPRGAVTLPDHILIKTNYCLYKLKATGT